MIKSQATFKTDKKQSINPKKIIFSLLAIGFVFFALRDISSVDVQAASDGNSNNHLIEDAVSGELALPPTPLMSFSEEGLAGSEQVIEKVVTIKSGQNLSAIFTDLGLSQGLLLRIIGLNDEARKLTKVYPGAELHFTLTHDGELNQLRYPFSDFQELIVHQDMDQLSTEIIEHTTQVQLVSTQGVITGSLFNAGKKAGMSDAMVMKLANIFSWDIDFVLEIREGDSFNLIYEKVYKNGEYLKDGEIIAASFTNQGDKYQAVRFSTADGEAGYYAPDGRSMKKAFLRAPLNFSYISSKFNPKRFHPILKRVKAHNGIDYRAPTGTPVYAAGDGRVISSAYHKYNGNFVFIQHPNGIVTKYLHFSKRAVKKGQRVKQGQTIGYVGSTGLSEAPHLHYEFIYNGVHRNPRTVKLPKSEPLKKEHMTAFELASKPLLAELDQMSATLVAQN
ncbi:peptidoglycan DD-metalloendopeptidase family protein [Marinicella sp. W31]|uniref:peptidoglycan DD-metalloendopeptidase family protein n=1 Tax=Marinicella sp. W31 TaxID=3023713 RepID=UPI003758082B